MSTTEPSATVERRAESADAPSRSTGQVVCIDNLSLMRRLGDANCDLIYADPPFDLTERNGTAAQPGAGGSAPTAQRLDRFLDFMRPRLAAMHRLLSDCGLLYVHVDWRTAHYIRIALDQIFGFESFINEIIWSYRSGGRPGPWFSRKHDTLLVYAKTPGAHTFNPLRGGSYRTRDLQLDADGRPFKTTRNGRIHFHPDGPAMTDVWELPILSTVAKERTGYHWQKPEALLDRIVRASSNEGDLVADFFCGSGTALVVAKRLGRRYLGCDVDPEAVAITRRRLENVGESDA